MQMAETVLLEDIVLTDTGLILSLLVQLLLDALCG